MIKDVFLVGIGSGIGGICRYLISLTMGQAGNGLPWGTLLAMLQTNNYMLFTLYTIGSIVLGIDSTKIIHIKQYST